VSCLIIVYFYLCMASACSANPLFIKKMVLCLILSPKLSYIVCSMYYIVCGTYYIVYILYVFSVCLFSFSFSSNLNLMYI